MGGAKAGEHASRIAVETVAETVRLSPQRDSQVLIRATEEANGGCWKPRTTTPAWKAWHYAGGRPGTGRGTGHRSVGDSRAYLFDERGLHVITDDQTWVNESGPPPGPGRGEPAAPPHAACTDDGDRSQRAVDHQPLLVPLAKGNLVLICSDGLHGVLEAPRMEQILDGGRRGGSLEEGCRNLIEAAKQAGGPDNVTVVLVRKS